jgi:hypothetical protein
MADLSNTPLNTKNLIKNKGKGGSPIKLRITPRLKVISFLL